MILGRNTQLWLGLANAIIGLLVMSDVVDSALGGGIMAVVSAAMVLIAGTSLTPVGDPRLPEGQSVTLPDGAAGTVERV